MLITVCILLVSLPGISYSFPNLGDAGIEDKQKRSPPPRFRFINGLWREISEEEDKTLFRINSNLTSKRVKKKPFLFKNVVCQRPGKSLIRTVCCSNSEDSDSYYEIITTRKISCDKPNCRETCSLIASLPDYDGLVKSSSAANFFQKLRQQRNFHQSESDRKSNKKFLEKSVDVTSLRKSADLNKNEAQCYPPYNPKLEEAVYKLLDLFKVLNELVSASTVGTPNKDSNCLEEFTTQKYNTQTPIFDYREIPSDYFPDINEEPFDNPSYDYDMHPITDSDDRDFMQPTQFTLPGESCETSTAKFCTHPPTSCTTTCKRATTGQTCLPKTTEPVKACEEKTSLPFQMETPIMFSHRNSTNADREKPSDSYPDNQEKHTDTELSVAEFVYYLSLRTESMYHRYKKAKWTYETNATHQSRKKAMIISLELTQYHRKLNKALYSIKSFPVDDPKLQRQIKLLYLPGMSILPDLKIAEFEQVLFAMKTIYSTATVGKWEHLSQKVYLKPAIMEVMAKSTDPEELRYYWLEWRKATGRRIRSLFEQYVDLMNQTALLNGFSDASEMWTRRYETEDFLQLLASNIDEIKPLYRQLHSYVRHKLHQRFGDITNATDSGFIPVHLTGDIWGEDWRNLYDILKPYPNQRDFARFSLDQNKYTTSRMVSDSEKIFHSLGFKPLPKTFWKQSKFLRTTSTFATCDSSAWDMFDENDFRVKFCSKKNVDDFYEMHRLLALVHYFSEYNSLPFAFRDIPNPAFGDAVGGAIVLSVKSRHHLEFLGIAKPTPHKPRRSKTVDATQEDINFLMYEALDSVAGLPYSYIIDLWRSKVFEGVIKPNEYNTKWWELREQHQGVEAPRGRTEEDFDIGAKYQIASNEPYLKHFLTRIMQYQFHEALCIKAGKNGPLHHCDISSSGVAGKVLRGVMAKGASQHWKNSMKELTGDRKLSSQPLIRYFEPLFAWLKETNANDQQHVGWEKNKL